MGTNHLFNELPEGRSGESALSHQMFLDVGAKSCPHCSQPIRAGAQQCRHCGQPLNDPRPGVSNLWGILLGIGVVGLVALGLAPVWPAERLYGKAINFMASWWGISPLSSFMDEPGRFRELINLVLKVYQGLHVMFYLTIIAVLMVLVVNWFKTRQLGPGGYRKLWIALGLLLLLFPAANLLISWHLFIIPGVLGTAIASLLVLAMGVMK